MKCPECKKDLYFDCIFQVFGDKKILIFAENYKCWKCGKEIAKIESYKPIIENNEIKGLCKLHRDREKRILKEKQSKCSIYNTFEKIL